MLDKPIYHMGNLGICPVALEPRGALCDWVYIYIYNYFFLMAMDVGRRSGLYCDRAPPPPARARARQSQVRAVLRSRTPTPPPPAPVSVAGPGCIGIALGLWADSAQGPLGLLIRP